MDELAVLITKKTTFRQVHVGTIELNCFVIEKIYNKSIFFWRIFYYFRSGFQLLLFWAQNQDKGNVR